MLMLMPSVGTLLTDLIQLRFYVKLDTKQVISETFLQANLLA